MKRLALIGVAALAAGCSTIPSSLPITGEAARTFFAQAPSGKGTIYFTCGKWFTKTAVGDSANESPACDFVVNGKAYSQLKKGSVGRLDLSPGNYEITQGDGAMSVSVPSKVDLKAGGVVLAVANYTHKAGVLGGGMTGNHVFTVDILTSGVVEQVQGKNPASLSPVQ